MKTIVKKLMSIIGAATLSLGMAVSISANASTSETPWISGSSYIRDKDSSSSVYVQNVSDYYYSWVTVYGRKSRDNTDYEVNYNPATGQTLTTHDVTIPARSQRRVRQFVYERGYRQAKVVFSGSGSGWWSPDCDGSYTFAN